MINLIRNLLFFRSAFPTAASAVSGLIKAEVNLGKVAEAQANSIFAIDSQIDRMREQEKALEAKAELAADEIAKANKLRNTLKNILG